MELLKETSKVVESFAFDDGVSRNGPPIISMELLKVGDMNGGIGTTSSLCRVSCRLLTNHSSPLEDGVLHCCVVMVMLSCRVTDVPDKLPAVQKYKLNETETPASKKNILGFAKQVAEVMIQVHTNNVIHGDLKPANLKKDATGRLKLAGFGHAMKVEDTVNMPEITGGSPRCAMHTS